MAMLSEIITVMQSILLSVFAVRFVMCCIQLAHDTDNKPQILSRMKNIIIAAVLTIVVYPLKAIVEHYFF